MCIVQYMIALFTNVPTVRPATTDGIEPVFMKPNVPPPAVRAPMMYAGVSMPILVICNW